MQPHIQHTRTHAVHIHASHPPHTHASPHTHTCTCRSRRTHTQSSLVTNNIACNLKKNIRQHYQQNNNSEIACTHQSMQHNHLAIPSPVFVTCRTPQEFCAASNQTLGKPRMRLSLHWSEAKPEWEWDKTCIGNEAALECN